MTLKEVFEYSRSATKHRYEITPTELRYSANKTSVSFPWKLMQRLSADRGANFYIHAQGHQKLAIWLDEPQIESFLQNFFRAWGKIDRGAACKAAFDYSTSNKAVGWIWVSISLLFPGMLALLLLLDGFNSTRCIPLLDHGKLAQAKLVKITKDRRGNWVWKLQFTGENGKTFEGKRTAYQTDDRGHPKTVDPTSVPVVYSPEDEKCWDVSMSADKPMPNDNQRKFTLLMTMSFGWAFLIIMGIGLLVGFLKLRHQLPYRELVRKIGLLLEANHLI